MRLVVALLLLPTALAAADEGPVLVAGRRAGAIAIDGRPDETAWGAAAEAGGFRQVQPDEGAEASAATRFRVLWDDDALYFAIDCDEPEAPTLQVARRDRAIEADAVHVTLDTTGDRRSGYRFTVYASGPQMDAILYDDVQQSTDWDAIWDSAVARSATGWSVELRIPLRSLRVPRGAQAFGLNVSRSRVRRHEESEWRFVPRGTAGVVSQLGVLTGVEGILPVREIELRPYLATTMSVLHPGPGEAPRSGFGACSTLGVAGGASARTCAGLDFKVGLTSQLALLGTLNPDFGQVEADQRVLNLTTFETQFPEKRPFFQEGLDLFQPTLRMADWGGEYGGDALQLFYSRRVGAALAPPPVGDGEELLLAPSAQSVLGAAKLVGHVGPAAVALLSAVMTRAEAQVRGADGELRDRTVAQPAHAAALRARLPLGGHAIAGLTATSWDPFDAGARHAQTGAVDLSMFDTARDWNAVLQLAGSRVGGGAPAREPDGTSIGDGDTGAAVSARVARDGGALTGFVDVDWLSPRLAVNDLGFARRANLFRALGAVSLLGLHANDLWQNARLTMSAREARTADLDDVLYRDLVLEPQVVLSSFWSVLCDLLWMPTRGDDRELGDGTFLRQHGGWGAVVLVGTDATRRLSAQLGGAYYRRGPAPTGQLFFATTLRPVPRLEAQLELDWMPTRDEPRLLRGATAPGAPGVPLDPAAAMGSDRLYLLAPQSSDAWSATLRGSLALAPSLTLQLYGQLFAARVSHGAALRAEARAGQRELDVRDLEPARPEDLAMPAETTVAALDVNLILRWEWRRGSTLYVVYAHDSSGPALSSAGHQDSVLVKVDVLSAL